VVDRQLTHGRARPTATDLDRGVRALGVCPVYVGLEWAAGARALGLRALGSGACGGGLVEACGPLWKDPEKLGALKALLILNLDVS
jgi:hypothetical protein